MKNINRRPSSVWKSIEKSFEISLARGSNALQESHFVERSWAWLIGTPLLTFQLEALLKKADGIHVDEYSHSHGALVRRPKVYVHVGVEGTTSTEILTESLIRNIELLDGYKVAVHGKYKGKLPCCKPG